MQGCLFHWSQCVWRKVQKYGLAATYSHEPAIHDIISKVLSLPLLPANQIIEVFERLSAEARSPQLRRLFDYVQNQWIEGRDFPPTTWSVYRRYTRTNNHLEVK